MRKFLLSLIAIGLFTTFVGCTNNNPKKENVTSSESSQSKVNTNSSSSSLPKENEIKEYKVGDSIAIDGEELTVTEIKRNYKTGNEYLKPKSGNEFVMVNVTIKNNSGDTIDVSPIDFKIIDSSGVYHSNNYILNKPLASTKLASGGNISGAITFEVPKDDANLTLVYKPSFSSDNYVEIKL